MARLPNHYPVFEHWYKTYAWILDRVDKMPKNASFSVANRLAALGLDITELLVEAIYSKEKAPFLRRVNIEIEKARMLLRLCADRRYLSLEQHAFVVREMDTVGKMCGGWLKSCEG